MSLHSGRCPASTSCSSCPTSPSAKCSFLGAARSQPLAAAAATTCIFGPSARCSTFRQWKHSSWHGLLDSASALVCFRPWQYSHVKLYSCRRCALRAVCPSKFLKLSSQLRAEYSVRRWNSCPYRYLWKCTNVFTVASNFLRVTQ
jgi:hypothetical protein